MDITQARPTDLIEVLYLLKVCIADMRSRGLTHWNSAYPDPQQIEKDLLEGSIYLLKDKGVTKGMVTLTPDAPSEYRQVAFASTEKPLYVKRLAVHPAVKDDSGERMLFDFALQFGRDHGFGSIRTDIWQTTTGSANTCEALQFETPGTAGPESPRFPMTCFEKRL